MWPGVPAAPLESAQSQNRVSQQSLWLDLVPKSLVAFSKLETRLGFEMQAQRKGDGTPGQQNMGKAGHADIFTE